MESARYGRTRYLVVVSCPRKPTQRKNTSQIFNNLMNAQNINNNCINNNINNNNSSSNSGNSTSKSGSNTNLNQNNNNNNSVTSSSRKSTNFGVQQADDDTVATNKLTGTNLFSSNSCNNLTMKTGTKNLIHEKDLTNLNAANRLFNANASIQQIDSDLERNDDQEQQNVNEVEESCLLGIDCNEKTSLGLVLRILGDTAIRLDGDG